jgi:hypothetical protein
MNRDGDWPTLGQYLRWWIRTHILRCCYNCGVKMLRDENDPRVESGELGLLFYEEPGFRICRSCYEYPEG